MTANEIIDLITNQGVLLGMLIVVLVYVFKVQRAQTEIIQKNTEATTENAKAIRENARVTEKLFNAFESHYKE